MRALDQVTQEQLHGVGILVLAGRPGGRAIARVLAQAGFRAVTQAQPGAARRRLATTSPELVVLHTPDAGPIIRTVLDRIDGSPERPRSASFVIVTSTPEQASAALRAAGRTPVTVVSDSLLEQQLPSTVRLMAAARLLDRRAAELDARLDALLGRYADAVDEGTFLAAMADTLEVGLVACDADGRLRYANRAARHLGLDQPMPGYGPALAPGQLAAQDGSPLPRDDDPLQRAWSGQDVTGQELTLDDARCGRRFLVAEAHPILADPGQRLGVVAAVHDVTQDRQVAGRPRRGGLRDPSTGLPHPAVLLGLIEKAAAQADRDERPFAVLRLRVSRTAPGEAADYRRAPEVALLRSLADRLASALRRGDVGSRFGDGFAVLCAAPVDEAQAVLLAGRVRAALSRPVSLDGATVIPSVCVGIATARNGELSAEDLVQQASAAAIGAERRGAGLGHPRQSPPRRTHQEKQDFASALRQLLRAGSVPGADLRLVYQPIFDPQGHVAAVEALVRWNPPGRQPVTPIRLLPVAEQLGLTSRLGDWVVTTACRQLSLWQQACPPGPRFWVSVNVSSDEVNSSGWGQRVHEAIRAAGAAPDRICLELAESTMRALTPEAVRGVDALGGCGVRLVLDDVAAPRRLLAPDQGPDIAMVKLSRGLVRSLDGEAPAEPRQVVASLVELAHRDQVRVVAQGVESDRQASLVVALGCDYAQGHYYARPLPADRITDLLRREGTAGPDRSRSLGEP